MTALSAAKFWPSRARSRRTRSSKRKCTREQGRRRPPHAVLHQLPPAFYFRTTDVTGIVQLPSGTEMVMPGDNVKISVELISPIAMDQGLRFAIREGGRTVGSGVVSKIVE
ncbi:MAG: hypothetical protein R3C16_01300 [Hyphomonadaceae bacterium]